MKEYNDLIKLFLLIIECNNCSKYIVDYNKFGSDTYNINL